MNIGLCLSGGVARGLAHIGVLKCLEEFNILPTHVAGASIGGIIGTFYASGVTSKQLALLSKDIKLTKLVKLQWPNIVKLDMSLVEILLHKYIKEDNFSSLEKQLYLSVTNLNTGKNEIHSQGKLFEKVIASATLPGIFPAIKSNGSTYVDGGLLNNFPVEPLIEHCDLIIGVNASPMIEEYTTNYESMKGLLQRCLTLITWQNTFQKFEQCDVLIDLKGVELYNFWNFDKSDELIAIGYEATLKKIHLIQSKLYEKTKKKYEI
jgi:NTE family protein